MSQANLEALSIDQTTVIVIAEDSSMWSHELRIYFVMSSPRIL
jgi:hypothetical protein